MKILVIRRDNIGDLVCTTPLLAALRRNFPAARIVALVNSYNAPVLAGNGDIDEVCAYRKAKHRDRGESALGIWWQTWRLMRRLRGENFDLAIIATPGLQPAAHKFARWVGARRVLGYGLDPVLPAAAIPEGMHECQAVMRLLEPLGIAEAPGPVRVHADAGRMAALRRAVVPPAGAGAGPLVGLHISARKPSQRWPVERFAELARRLHERDGSRFLVFWSPGAEDHPQHPGDDGKARQLVTLAAGLPLAACPSTQLEHLIAGLALCDRIVCADGGAMHLAAGLGKPIVCLFGKSGADRWHPWGVRHELLQMPSQDVADIGVDQVIAAVERLRDG